MVDIVIYHYVYAFAPQSLRPLSRLNYHDRRKQSRDDYSVVIASDPSTLHNEARGAMQSLRSLREDWRPPSR